MKTLLTAALLLCMAAAPVLADRTGCDADLDALRAALEQGSAAGGVTETLAVLKPVEEDGRCILRDVAAQVSASPPMMLEAQEIVWRATWLEPRSMVPHALVLDMRGVRMVPQLKEQADISYQMRLIAELDSTELHLDYAVDPATKRLLLIGLDVGRPGGDRIAVSGDVENFDLAALTAQPDGWMQLRLTDLDIKLRNVSWFETGTMMWLPVIYPEFGDTPEAAVGYTKRLLTEMFRSMPGSLVAQQDRTALVSMVDTLPHPRGVMQLKLRAENGISGMDLLVAMLSGLPILAALEEPLAGARLSADWQPPQDLPDGEW